MNTRALRDTRRSLGGDGSKWLLTMDRSNPICNKRFDSLRISQPAEVRHISRELIGQAHEN